MPRYQISWKADLAGITNIVPANKEAYDWRFKFVCTKCREPTDSIVNVNGLELIEMTNSKGSANLIMRCKFCKSEGSVDLELNTVMPYNLEKTGKFSPLIIIEGRGWEPTEWVPAGGFKGEGAETGTKFEEIDLSEREWSDYDEKAGEAVEILEIESSLKTRRQDQSNGLILPGLVSEVLELAIQRILHVVDAFTTKAFSGNPAAVVILDEYPEDVLLTKIAREFNLSETAFLVPKHADSTHEFHIRWFTPTVEVPLCGHATLASSHILFSKMTEQQRQSGPLRFSTLSGDLVVRHKSSDSTQRTSHMEMVLPGLPTVVDDTVDRELLARAFGISVDQIIYVGTNQWGALVEIDAASTPIHAIKPDYSLVAAVNTPAVLLASTVGTHVHGQYDFVSRMFAPNLGVNEDPVCGSAHCVLAHYYSSKLGKTEFKAFQASARGGEVGVVHEKETGRVHLTGNALATPNPHKEMQSSQDNRMGSRDKGNDHWARTTSHTSSTDPATKRGRMSKGNVASSQSIVPSQTTPSAFDNLFENLPRLPSAARLPNGKGHATFISSTNVPTPIDREKERIYDVNLGNTQMPPYEPLMDIYLKDYFNNPTTRDHLIRLGLIDKDGNIVDAKKFKYNQIELNKKAYREALSKKHLERDIDRDIELALKAQFQAKRTQTNKINRSDTAVPPYADFYQKFPTFMYKTALIYSENSCSDFNAEHILLERLRNQPTSKLSALGYTRTEIDSRLKSLERRQRNEYRNSSTSNQKTAKPPCHKPSSQPKQLKTDLETSTDAFENELTDIFKVVKKEYEFGNIYLTENRQLVLRKMTTDIPDAAGSTKTSHVDNLEPRKSVTISFDTNTTESHERLNLPQLNSIRTEIVDTGSQNRRSSGSSISTERVSCDTFLKKKHPRPKSARPTRNSTFPATSAFSDMGSDGEYNSTFSSLDHIDSELNTTILEKRSSSKVEKSLSESEKSYESQAAVLQVNDIPSEGCYQNESRKSENYVMLEAVKKACAIVDDDDSHRVSTGKESSSHVPDILSPTVLKEASDVSSSLYETRHLDIHPENEEISHPKEIVDPDLPSNLTTSAAWDYASSVNFDVGDNHDERAKSEMDSFSNQYDPDKFYDYPMMDADAQISTVDENSQRNLIHKVEPSQNQGDVINSDENTDDINSGRVVYHDELDIESQRDTKGVEETISNNSSHGPQGDIFSSSSSGVINTGEELEKDLPPVESPAYTKESHVGHLSAEQSVEGLTLDSEIYSDSIQDIPYSSSELCQSEIKNRAFQNSSQDKRDQLDSLRTSECNGEPSRGPLNVDDAHSMELFECTSHPRFGSMTLEIANNIALPDSTPISRSESIRVINTEESVDAGIEKRSALESAARKSLPPSAPVSRVSSSYGSSNNLSENGELVGSKSAVARKGAANLERVSLSRSTTTSSISRKGSKAVDDARHPSRPPLQKSHSKSAASLRNASLSASRSTSRASVKSMKEDVCTGKSATTNPTASTRHSSTSNIKDNSIESSCTSPMIEPLQGKHTTIDKTSSLSKDAVVRSVNYGSRTLQHSSLNSLKNDVTTQPLILLNHKYKSAGSIYTSDHADGCANNTDVMANQCVDDHSDEVEAHHNSSFRQQSSVSNDANITYQEHSHENHLELVAGDPVHQIDQPRDLIEHVATTLSSIDHVEQDNEKDSDLAVVLMVPVAPKTLPPPKTLAPAIGGLPPSMPLHTDTLHDQHCGSPVVHTHSTRRNGYQGKGHAIKHIDEGSEEVEEILAQPEHLAQHLSTQYIGQIPTLTYDMESMPETQTEHLPMSSESEE
ncbi:hypothetical protein BSLG_000118 [Batrachochytrium salamandrivorans]|nr:hypothetical protein BSLG_000118 [Batrachochytrium salamandrivorans]